MNDETQLTYWIALCERGDAAACYNAGFLLQEQADLQKAIAYYEKSIQLNPGLCEAYNNLGGLYKTKNEFDEALKFYLTALKINPYFPHIHNNIGVVFKDQQHFNNADHFFKQALMVNPANATAYYNLGMLYEAQCRLPEASGYYKKAFDLDPALTVAYWSFQMTRIQAQCLQAKNSIEAIDNIKALAEWAHQHRVDGRDVVGYSMPFFISYQESNNRDFLSACGDLCASLMQPFQKEMPIINQQNQKIRLGFVSDHFHDHSVWQAVLKGWYKHIDKTRFEIVSFCLDDIKDAQSEIARQQSDSFFDGAKNIEQWRDVILAQQIDVLFFPAIGTSQIIHQLACLRMAPVQVTSWGHPETSGLPTLDYYLSAHDFEPPQAQDNYRETLINLPALGACYEPLQLEDGKFNLEEAGLTNDSRVFVAPGKSFKYAADYDFIFPEIAKQVNNAKIIFFISKPDGLAEELQQRITNAFSAQQMDVNEHVLFIPLLKRAEFHALMKTAHVYLDTIGFSGFNTAMQSIECGLPMVTYEGKFMRGRFGSAILRRLGMEELIVGSAQDYIAAAVKLANDDDYRENIKRKVVATASQLYADVSVVRALEAFVVSVVKR